MTEIWNYPKMGIPFKEGEYYFYSYNTGLQNQNIIYMKKELDRRGRSIFLDPNKFSEDGTVALSAFSVSNDSKYVAYGISRGGSDWKEFFIRELKQGRTLRTTWNGLNFPESHGIRMVFSTARFDEP